MSITRDDFKGSVNDFLLEAPIFRRLTFQMGLNAATADMGRLYLHHDRYRGWPLPGVPVAG